jgi:hypothetical protein
MTVKAEAIVPRCVLRGGQSTSITRCLYGSETMLSTAELYASAEDLRLRQTWLRARALPFRRRWAPAVSVEAAWLDSSVWRSAGPLGGDRTGFHDQPRIPEPRTLLRQPREASLHVERNRLSPRPRCQRSRRSRKCGRCARGGASGTIQATCPAGCRLRGVIATSRERCRPRHPQRGGAGSTRRRCPSRLSVRR